MSCILVMVTFSLLTALHTLHTLFLRYWISPPALSNFYRGQKVGKLCADFRPHSHSKRPGFKTEQYIENLKDAHDVQMIALNSGQDSFLISPPIFTGE